MKKNLRDRLLKRKIQTAGPFRAFCILTAFNFIAKKRNVSFVYEGDVKTVLKRQVIILSQHCATDEWIYTIAGLRKRDIHTVVGYHHFFAPVVYHLLMWVGTISKFLYQPDPLSTIQMLHVIKDGGSILLFPEGIQSTSGSTHPINPATMRFLMKCGLPVVLCTSQGSYLTTPRYSTVIRPGKITVTYKVLFTQDDYKNHSQEELYARLMESFKYNEFEFNRKARIPFGGGGVREHTRAGQHHLQMPGLHGRIQLCHRRKRHAVQDLRAHGYHGRVL